MTEKTNGLLYGEMVFNILLNDIEFVNEVDGVLYAFSDGRIDGLLLRTVSESGKRVDILVCEDRISDDIIVIVQNKALLEVSLQQWNDGKHFEHNDYYGTANYIKKTLTNKTL